MRILIVNYEYPPVGGGAATAAQAIANEFVKLGHHVVILTGGYKNLPSRFEENGIVINRLPGIRRRIDHATIWEMFLFLIVALLFVPSIARKERIERALVFFSLPCGPVGLVGRWICGIPYIVSLRGGDIPGTEPSLNLIHRFLSPLRVATLRNSIAIVANSDGLRKIAEAADSIPVHVIANGVDSERFCPPPSTEPHAALRLLFVGRFQSQKNLPFLFREVARLEKGTFELHLVGDGPQRKMLDCLANNLGISDSIVWHGWLSREALPQIYRSVDCLVNSSLYEGMPNVVLEAMASGLPLLASNVAGNNELVVHEKTGFLFNLNTPSDHFAAMLNRLRDADLRRQMGEAARNRVLNLFGWDRVSAEYLHLLSAEPLRK